MKRFTIPLLVAALASAMIAAPQVTAPKSTGKPSVVPITTAANAKSHTPKGEKKAKTKAKKNKQKATAK